MSKFSNGMVRAKRFLLQSNLPECTDELNAFLAENDGRIIDVQTAAQSLGQIFVLVLYVPE